MSKDKLPGDPSLPSSPEELQSLIREGEKNYKYSVEDFFRNPEKSSYQISPDGAILSFFGPYKRRRNLFVQKLGESKALRITSETARDIADYGWANAKRLIYIKDSAGDENFQLFAVNANGSDPLDLTPYDGVRIKIIDVLRDNDQYIIIGMNKDNPMLFEPYRLDIYTASLTKLAKNDNPAEPIDSWMTDHRGKLRIAVKIVGGINSCLMYRQNEEAEFKPVFTTDFKTTVAPLAFDENNSDQIYVSSNLGRDKTAIIKFDMEKAEETGPVVFEAPDVDVHSILWSKKKNKLTGVTYNTWKMQMFFFDEEWESIHQYMVEKIGDQEFVAVSRDKDENHWIFRSFTDKSLGAYYLYNKQNQEVRKLADISPWLDDEDMSDMMPMSYNSRDGVKIQAYLSLPKQPRDGLIPFVIHPHGGPWVRDNWGYNATVQLLTSRGYGVLQMNYRGSTGYGKEFWTSSFKQWGRSMQDDISDGVKWLIDRHGADPNRIAIFGGSYGGYATLAGICFTPDLYCCAVDFVGVSNLFTFMNTIPPYWKPYLDMFYEMVGHPEKDEKMMRSCSPVFHTDRITAPLFVVQGANDPRVNIDESDQMVGNLRERGIDVPYMVKYDEGHGFGNEENRIEFYKAMLGFLYRYMS